MFHSQLSISQLTDCELRASLRECEEWAGVPKDGTLVSNAQSMSGHTHIPPVYAVPPSQGLQTLGFLHFKPSQSRPKAVPGPSHLPMTRHVSRQADV